MGEGYSSNGIHSLAVGYMLVGGGGGFIGKQLLISIHFSYNILRLKKGKGGHVPHAPPLDPPVRIFQGFQFE